MKVFQLISILSSILASSVSFAATDIPLTPDNADSTENPITNFHEVTGGIYRGARPTDAGLEYLTHLHVRTVIDLQGGDVIKFDPTLNDWFEQGETPASIAEEDAETTSLGMTFYNYPLSSFEDVSAKEDSEIDEVLSIMHDTSAQPVFVHCEHGRDRTGLVVALYEVEYLGYSVKHAHKEWEAMGHSGAIQLATHELDDYYDKKTKELVHKHKKRL